MRHFKNHAIHTHMYSYIIYIYLYKYFVFQSPRTCEIPKNDNTTLLRAFICLRSNRCNGNLSELYKYPFKK